MFGRRRQGGMNRVSYSLIEFYMICMGVNVTPNVLPALKHLSRIVVRLWCASVDASTVNLVFTVRIIQLGTVLALGTGNNHSLQLEDRRSG